LRQKKKSPTLFWLTNLIPFNLMDFLCLPTSPPTIFFKKGFNERYYT
jgi:hypothetical protein